MRLGYASMNNPQSPRPQDLARQLEERGFDSLWIGEHSHIPTSRATPYPAGGDLPDGYLAMMDPYVSLMAAAAVTTNLRLGTGVLLPLERHPLVLAKEIATLDVLSGGRTMIGVGVGWNREQHENLSTVPWAQRYRALREVVAALRVLWTADRAEFHGQYVDFDPVWSFPKPAQPSGPPILMGSGGKLGLQHVVEWCDGWCPLDIAFREVERGLQRMRERATEAGRDPASIEITLYTVGDPDRDRLLRYRELGVARVVLGADPSHLRKPDEVVALLDRYADLAGELACA